MRRSLYKCGLALVVAVSLSACSMFTSIDRDANGDYVITGIEAPGQTGFVWICDYDPATKTLTVKEVHR